VRSGDAETVVNHYLKNDSGLNGASEWRADERAIWQYQASPCWRLGSSRSRQGQETFVPVSRSK